MRKKSNYLLVILFALSFLLGVGYAVVNSISLTVSGTATSVTEDLDVSFTSTTSVSDASKVTATAQEGSLNATISVKDMTLNETVTATYTIKNNETDVLALLSQESLTNSNTEYFTVSASLGNDGYVCTGSTSTVTLTVKMIKTPVDSADSSASISLNLTATPQDPGTSTVC